jgi:hypothetical protein
MLVKYVFDKKNIIVACGLVLTACNNFEPPVFENTKPVIESQRFTIIEGIAGLSIDTVHASGNGELTFSIVGGDPEHGMRIDPKTGVLFTASSLDFEKIDKYELAVRVVDEVGSLEATATIYVNVLNAPEIPSMQWLLGRYTFLDGKADDVGMVGGVTGSVFAKLLPDRFWQVNESLLFDSQNHRVEFTVGDNYNYQTASKGTLAVWVKFDDTDHMQHIAFFGNEKNNDRYLDLLRRDPASQILSIEFRSSDTDKKAVYGQTPVTSSNYHFLVVTSDGQEWAIYIDGIKEKLSTTTDNKGYWMSSVLDGNQFVLGNVINRQAEQPSNFAGNLDDALIFNIALTEEEVKALYADMQSKYN